MSSQGGNGDRSAGGRGEETMLDEKVVVVVTHVCTYKSCGAWKHMLITQVLIYSTE